MLEWFSPVITVASFVAKSTLITLVLIFVPITMWALPAFFITNRRDFMERIDFMPCFIVLLGLVMIVLGSYESYERELVQLVEACKSLDANQ